MNFQVDQDKDVSQFFNLFFDDKCTGIIRDETNRSASQRLQRRDTGRCKSDKTIGQKNPIIVIPLFYRRIFYRSFTQFNSQTTGV
jgi:hypothetical protein